MGEPCLRVKYTNAINSFLTVLEKGKKENKTIQPPCEGEFIILLIMSRKTLMAYKGKAYFVPVLTSVL